jgi:Na+-transporting NADH:ubiquinone oxidoreductase subunit A
MADITVRKGMNIRLAGAPAADLERLDATDQAAVFPTEFHGVKPRLLVKEGDSVQRGSPLFVDKRNPEFRVCAPAGGAIGEIRFGPRRVVEQIVIRVDPGAEPVDFGAVRPGDCRTLSREKVLRRLLETGYLALLIRRPFSRMADPAVPPKSIFVNAMATAPFQTDAAVAVRGLESAFQAGLDLLGRLTDGAVHLVLPAGRDDLPEAFTRAERVTVHQVAGPHPAGNASIHIHHLDPIRPGDTVWTITACDLIQIGRLFLDGALPPDRVVALGGPAVRHDACRHYRTPVGGALDPWLPNRIRDGEHRILTGDVLGGRALNGKQFLPFHCPGLTVLAEDRSRQFLGWLAPGGAQYSHSRLFLSTWRPTRDTWDLGTNTHGGKRAMVLTGLYDRFMPLPILVDYLVRAVLANDSDEAVQLGILETDPEDFALCAFACPSKMDLVGIIRRGLDMIEQEGL